MPVALGVERVVWHKSTLRSFASQDPSVSARSTTCSSTHANGRQPEYAPLCHSDLGFVSQAKSPSGTTISIANIAAGEQQTLHRK